MDNSARFSKKLFLGIVILILLLIYGFFWLNFFGVIHLPLPAGKQAQQKQEKKIITLINSIKSIEKPYSPRATQLSHEGAKATFENMMNRAQAAITRGNMEAAQKELLDAKNMLREFGDPLQTKNIPEEEKLKHDPKNKYIKNDSIDPRLLDLYLQIIDLLVETDKDY